MNVSMKAIVTGHTRGLGAAVAADFLRRGIPVMGLARHNDDKLQKIFPALLIQQQIDLADTAALEKWLRGTVLRRFLVDCDIAVLINNAGVIHPIGALGAMSLESIGPAVAINVTAPLMLASAVAAATINACRILHISSGAGRHALPGWSVYCATKAALDHHARAVEQEKNPRIRICSMAPGVIDTDMQSEIRATSLAQFPLREQFDVLKTNGALRNPSDIAKRIGDFVMSEQFSAIPVTALKD